MSLLKKLGLVEDDTVTPPKKEIKPTITHQPVTQVVIPTDDKFTEFFKQVIKDNNIQGPDYYEFMQAIESMASQPLPENSKFAAVFAGFAAQGITKQKLLDSANFYLQKLDEHATGFAQSIQQMTTTEIDSRAKEIEKLTKNSEEITQAIADLNKKLQENSAKVLQLGVEKTTKANEIQAKQNNFDMSLTAFKQTISSNIQKIETYVS